MRRFCTLAVATGLAVVIPALIPPSSTRAQVFPGGVPGQGQVPGQVQGQLPGQGGPGMAGAPPGMMGMGMGMGVGPGMGGGGQGSSPLMILLAPSVQKELKLTDAQKTKVYAFAKKANQKSREMMQAVAVGGNANPQMFMETGMRIRQETNQGISEILEAPQKERLDQIVLRVEGPLAVARPEIAAKLRLNDNQQQAVQEIMGEMRSQTREMFISMRQQAAAGGGQVNPAQMREMTTQLRKQAVVEISKVIDRKQQAAFDKLLGAPFDVKKLESETASVDPTGGAQNPGDAAQTKDATTPSDTEAAKETATTKKPASSSRKKSRTKTGSGANR